MELTLSCYLADKSKWFSRQIICVFKKGRFGVVKLTQIILIIEITLAPVHQHDKTCPKAIVIWQLNHCATL